MNPANLAGTDPLAALFALLGSLPAPVRQSMRGLYRQTLLDQLELLAHALRGPDTGAQQVLAHKIAGSAAMMQDSGLADALRALSVAIVGADRVTVSAGWQRVQSCAGRTLEALEARDVGNAAAPGRVRS